MGHRTRRLIRVFTVCLQELKSNTNEKSIPNTPKIGNGLIQLIGWKGPSDKCGLRPQDQLGHLQRGD